MAWMAKFGCSFLTGIIFVLVTNLLLAAYRYFSGDMSTSLPQQHVTPHQNAPSGLSLGGENPVDACAEEPVTQMAFNFCNKDKPVSQSVRCVIYNRVPKCGSTSAINILRKLAQINKNKFQQTGPHMIWSLEPHKQVYRCAASLAGNFKAAS